MLVRIHKEMIFNRLSLQAKPCAKYLLGISHFEWQAIIPFPLFG
jgi:hypothetical protein